MICLYRPFGCECAAAIARLAGVVYVRPIMPCARLPEDVPRGEIVCLFGVTFGQKETAYLAKTSAGIVFFSNDSGEISLMQSYCIDPGIRSMLQMPADVNVPLTVQVWRHLFPHEDLPAAVHQLGRLELGYSDPEDRYFYEALVDMGLFNLPPDQLDEWIPLLHNEYNIVNILIGRTHYF